MHSRKFTALIRDAGFAARQVKPERTLEFLPVLDERLTAGPVT